MRGQLGIVFRSPLGTESVFATQRLDPNPNYIAWTFLSRRFYGEPLHHDSVPWTLVITDYDPDEKSGILVQAQLSFRLVDSRLVPTNQITNH
jgi:hypothetical protein